ncbi:hypothetical protein MKW92_036203 [Papaver armeniacum]|nr:hypothetical protein MKW92_036203 [Papaver armeniacum]
MGKKGKWFTAVKKTFGSESREKKDQVNSILSYQRRYNKKKWFGKQKQEDPFTLQVENEPTPPPPPPPQEEIKVDRPLLTAHKLALASATVAEAAVATAQAAAEVVRLTSAVAFRESGKLNKDAAATKIQTAFRCYLARMALRALRVATLMDGQSVKRQAATTTLRCMQTLSRVQSQIRGRRIRMSEENQALQKQLQQKHEKELETMKAFIHKQEAAMRRERALAYAFTQQQRIKSETTPERGPVESAKGLSFSGSLKSAVGQQRRYSGPPKVDSNPLMKDIAVHAEQLSVGSGCLSRD